MFKRIAIAVLAVAFIAVSAHAETELIGGVAAGKCIGGPSWNQTFFAATAGARIKTFEYAKVYTVARLNGTDGEDSEWGGKVILAGQFQSIPWLHVLLDAGILDNGFISSEGEKQIAPSVGGGVAATVAPAVTVVLYGEAIKRGAGEWDKVVWLAPTWHVKL